MASGALWFEGLESFIIFGAGSFFMGNERNEQLLKFKSIKLKEVFRVWGLRFSVYLSFFDC